MTWISPTLHVQQTLATGVYQKHFTLLSWCAAWRSAQPWIHVYLVNLIWPQSFKVNAQTVFCREFYRLFEREVVFTKILRSMHKAPSSPKLSHQPHPAKIFNAIWHMERAPQKSYRESRTLRIIMDHLSTIYVVFFPIRSSRNKRRSHMFSHLFSRCQPRHV